MASPRDIDRIKKFADWLRQTISDCNYKSQRQFSITANVSPATISRILNYGQLPDDETITKIAAALNKPVKDVMLAAGYPVDDSGQLTKQQKKQPKDLLKILEQEDYTLNGRLATPEDKDRLATVVEAMFWDAKEKNKRKR